MLSPFCERAGLQRRAYAHETSENWAEQVWKMGQCCGMVSGFEAATGAALQCALQIRPDSLMLEPFPSHASYPPGDRAPCT